MFNRQKISAVLFAAVSFDIAATFRTAETLLRARPMPTSMVDTEYSSKSAGCEIFKKADLKATQCIHDCQRDAANHAQSPIMDMKKRSPEEQQLFCEIEMLSLDERACGIFLTVEVEMFCKRTVCVKEIRALKDLAHHCPEVAKVCRKHDTSCYFNRMP